MLSGDLNGDDGASQLGDNSFHLITTAGTDASAVIDGFVVTAGNANNSGGNRDRGAGILCLGSVSPTVRNCRFVGNRCTFGGGAGYINNGGAPTFTDCSFEDCEQISVEQHVRYVASFHPNWDDSLERQLREASQLDGKARVGALSPGMRQRLALLLAVCHRPTLLLLDEPVSALDPVARVEALRLILERVIEDGATVVVSSHVLHDVEQIIDHVLCLEQGSVVEDTPLDELKERYAEWIVTSSGTDVPAHLSEPYVLSREGAGRRVRLEVSASESEREAFAARHDVAIEERPLDLARIFPLLSTGGRS